MLSESGKWEKRFQRTKVSGFASFLQVLCQNRALLRTTFRIFYPLGAGLPITCHPERSEGPGGCTKITRSWASATRNETSASLWLEYHTTGPRRCRIFVLLEHKKQQMFGLSEAVWMVRIFFSTNVLPLRGPRILVWFSVNNTVKNNVNHKFKDVTL